MKEITGFKIKKVGRRGNISIWIVDGKKIRSELDEEFTNFGQHFRYKYIPKNEFWLDREASPNERIYFIDHLLVENKYMKEGATYEKATTIADAIEMAERYKSKDYVKDLAQTGYPKYKELHKEILKRLDNGITIWIVNGKLVRTFLRVEFVAGGHEYVYDFVPKDEVWIDDDILTSERPFVILHELFERNKMKKGMEYLPAHRLASRLEWRARHDEKVLEKGLKKVEYTI